MGETEHSSKTHIICEFLTGCSYCTNTLHN